jgi:hypothetical protein
MTRAWFVWCVLCVGACTTERMIGSTCIDGVCETAAASTRIPCLIATGPATIEAPPNAVDELCVTDLVHTDGDDMAPCRMLLLVDDPMQTCDGLGLDDALNAPSASANVCEIPQLERGRRGVAAMSATGWYIEEVSPTDPCASIGAQRARFDGALVSGTVRLECAHAFADPGSVSDQLRPGEDVLLVDPESCAGLPPLPERMPSEVGSLCSARFEPPEGFYTNRTHIDARSNQCETGVCLVDATRSAQQWPCLEGDEACADAGPPDLGNLSYCSCRCDAKGDPSRVACQCPSGFSCRDVLSGEAPGVLAGGYCMRESAF